MLEATHITVRYGAVRAVADAAVSVRPGEVVAVLGANGAGKTSLLRALSGLVRHDGQVTVDGVDTRAPHESRAAGVVHVPQGRGLFRRLTVEQNLVLGALGHRPARNAAVAVAVDRVPELADWLPRRVDSLSGGEQALVAIGRLIAGRPRYALLDELGLGLAPISADRLDAEIATLRAEGTGVLVVEQYAPRALALADRVVVLDRGHVAYEGDPAGAGSAEELVAGYLGAPR